MHQPKKMVRPARSRRKQFAAWWAVVGGQLWVALTSALTIKQATDSKQPEPPRRAPFAVVKSPKEIAVGSTFAAQEIERDCVRKPTKSNCDCKEMIAACNEQRASCLTNVDYFIKGGNSAGSPAQVAHELFRAKFDHPLLNTLQLAPNDHSSRVFNEDVDFSKIKSRGKCSEEEMNGLDQCLAMFWQCDRIESGMSEAAEAQSADLQYIYDHPGSPPW